MINYEVEKPEIVVDGFLLIFVYFIILKLFISDEISRVQQHHLTGYLLTKIVVNQTILEEGLCYFEEGLCYFEEGLCYFEEGRMLL